MTTLDLDQPNATDLQNQYPKFQATNDDKLQV